MAIIKSIFVIIKWILIFVVVSLLIWGLFSLAIYIIKTPERIELKKQQEQYAMAEKAYQACLDKVTALTTWEIKPVDKSYGIFSDLFDAKTVPENKYFDEWKKNGSPYYDKQRGYWEIAFMKWMIEAYPEFCKEYSTESINYFLLEKERKIFGLPKLPSLKGVGLPR